MAFPFIAIAILVVGIGLAMLMPKPHIENARAAKLSDFQFPRSNKGDPCGLVKGTVRYRAPNTIGLGNFRAEKITEKVSTGLFSSKKVTTGYKYHASLGLGVCIGPGAVFKKIWYGKHIIWEGTATTGDSAVIDLPKLLGGKDKNGGVGGTVRFYGGDFDQTQNAELADACDPNYPAWVGLAYVVFEDFWFGNSTSIEPIHFEVQCFSDVLEFPAGQNIMPNGYDENPIETLADLIATQWGKLGFTTGAIDTANFLEAALTIWDENNGGSWEITKPNRGADLIREILRQIEATIYQDPQSGLIRIKLIRQDYVLEELPVLDPSNVRQVRNLSKTLWQQTINQVRVKFRDRDDAYADDAAQDHDFANINMQNKVRSDDIEMPGVYRADLAQELAARERSKVSVPLYGFEIECNREQVILRPGDPFILSWPPYGLVQIVMRVRTFGLGEYAKGFITIVASQDEKAAADVVFAPPVPSEFVPGSGVASEILVHSSIEAPLWFLRQLDSDELGASGYVWALPRQPASISLSYDMAISSDAFATYATALDGADYTGSGLLQGAYAAATGADDGYDSSVGGIIVDGLDGAYIPVSGGDIQTAGEGLILLSGTEIIGYETVAALGGGSYRLTGLRRGLLDTVAVAHADNATVVFLTGIEGVDTDNAYGNTGSATFRLADRTSSDIFDVADASDITVNFDRRAERPARPRYITAGGVRLGTAARSATMAIAWRESNRFDNTIRYEDDATQAVEVGQDNEIKWRVNGGAWTTVYVTGASTTINTSGATAGHLLEIEGRGRRGGLLSRTATTVAVTLT